MNIQNAAERPAADSFFQPISITAEEDRLPCAKQLERFADVLVAASVIQADMVRVRLLIIRARTGVHAFGPSELGLGREVLRELVFKSAIMAL